eukprot:scaffold66049_cov28-Tisochrysis_lutea.AAC.5
MACSRTCELGLSMYGSIGTNPRAGERSPMSRRMTVRLACRMTIRLSANFSIIGGKSVAAASRQAEKVSPKRSRSKVIICPHMEGRHWCRRVAGSEEWDDAAEGA